MKWKKYPENTPKNLEVVLITNGKTVELASYIYDPDIPIFDNLTLVFEDIETEDVTHWMKLPKLPS